MHSKRRLQLSTSPTAAQERKHAAKSFARAVVNSPGGFFPAVGHTVVGQNAVEFGWVYPVTEDGVYGYRANVTEAELNEVRA